MCFLISSLVAIDVPRLMTSKANKDCESSCKTLNVRRFQSCSMWIKSFAICKSRRFRPGVPNLSLTMYPFSNSTDEHLPQSFLCQKG